MMRRRLLPQMRPPLSAILMASLVLSAFSEPAWAQQTRQVWLIGIVQNDEDRIDGAFYIDSTLFNATQNNIRRAWTWWYSKSGTNSVSLSEFDCSGRRWRQIKEDIFDDKGVPLIALRDTAWDYVTPGKAGELSLEFVCSKPQTWPTRALLIDASLTPGQHAIRLFESPQ